MQKLDSHIRKEISNEVYRIFALMSSRISFAFDGEGVTIRVAFDNPQDLNGPEFISGVSEGINKYFEVPVGKRQT